MSYERCKKVKEHNYQRIILNRKKIWIRTDNFGNKWKKMEDKWIKVTKDWEWVPIKKVVPNEISKYELLPNNHPDVEKGNAKWFNYNTLLMGYNLKNNEKVYMPVYQKSKEILNRKLRYDIKIYGYYLVAKKREKLYKNTLLKMESFKNIPEDIINKIATFARAFNV